MADAWIDGKPVRLEAAAQAAARLIAASRLPLIAGLGTDVAGARAAVALARRIGGVVDHMHSGWLLRDLTVLREAGMMLTTPNEARARGDVVLLVGGGLLDAWPELPERLLRAPLAPEAGTQERRIVWLCPGRAAARIGAGLSPQTIGRDAAELPLLLAALRARLAGRPVGKLRVPAKTLDALVAFLQSAHFGVAVWTAAELDALTIEMLCGLVSDLNAKTRFSGLALSPPDNAAGVLQVCGWTTALPPRTGFARGEAEHDPWRYDSARLVESGEADCLVWISAWRPAPPPWNGALPTVALTAGPARFAPPPHVQIAVGRPGTDHDAVAHLAATGTLVPLAAARRGAAISVADALAAIAAALPRPEGAPC